MAGVLFVVVVPTARYEAELVEAAGGKSKMRDPEMETPMHAGNGRPSFHKSESYLNGPHSLGNSSPGGPGGFLLSPHGGGGGLLAPGSPPGSKLYRAVTTGALDNLQEDSNKPSPQLLVPLPALGVPLGSSLGAPRGSGVGSATLHPISASLLAVPGQEQPQPEDGEDFCFVQFDKMPMEKCLSALLAKKKIENAVWSQGKNSNFYQVIFSTPSGEACEDCLQCLQTAGIGTKMHSVLSVVPCSLYYEAADAGGEVHAGGKFGGAGGLEGSSDEEMGSDEKLRDGGKQQTTWSKFVSSVRARLTVAQVVEQVRGNAELTFDFFMLLLVAGLVAALGLVENSSVILVASMLISPLMGPILAGTFGTVIQDRQLQRVGVLHELFGLLTCLVIGFFFGLVIASLVDHWGTGDWPTTEMCARGTVRSLWVGCLIALPSGAGVALSVLGGNAGSLVGVAISASLLPPAVNAGLLWALAVIELLKDTSDPYHHLSHVLEDAQNATAAAIDSAAEAALPKPYYSDYKPAELAALGAVSLCLTLLNILCIFVAGIIVLKIKEVAPRSSSDDLDIFWKHDIRIARDYNRTMHGEEGLNLGQQLMDELAGMSSDKLNAVVDEASRDSVLAKIRRLSLMNNGPTYNDLTVTSGGYGLRSNQSTWSPSTGQTSSRQAPRPTVQELEDLYNTISGIRPNNRNNYAPSLGVQLRRASVAAGVAARGGTGETPGRRVSVSPHKQQQQQHHLATILETNSPGTTPVSLRSPRRPSSTATTPATGCSTPGTASGTPGREGSMRFIVTPAAAGSDVSALPPPAPARKSLGSPSKKLSF